MSQISFLNVRSGREKIERIVQTITQNYHELKRIQILCPSETVATFIDDTLWTTPPESFLPHSIRTDETLERIAITQNPDRINRAEVLINLTSDPIENVTDFETVYELWDECDSAKTTISKNKKEHYLRNKYAVT